MRTPDSLTALVDHGIIDEVVRPLMSGKEAQVYLVLSGGEQRVAKIYKEAQNRSFQNRADYTEGRKVRNSRDQRAMGRGSRHGKAQNEAAWRSAEVDMIYRLRDAGVRVPNPFHFIDGVLIMELVVDAEGFPAPRLGDLVWEPADASALFKQLLAEVVRMLSIGVVHGDLSDFNVLMSAAGPVVIDFPQSVDAATNANARKLLLRDVENLNRFAAKFDPTHSPLPYAEEMWELYKRNALTPETQLSGRFKGAQKAANTTAVLDLISDANKDERRRREARGQSMRGTSPDANPSHDTGPATRGSSHEERAPRPQRDAQPRAPQEREVGAPARTVAARAPASAHGARPAARNFDTRPPLGERARPPHSQKTEPSQRELRPGGQQHELHRGRDERSTRAPAPARDAGPTASPRDERALPAFARAPEGALPVFARAPEGALRPRARSERSRDERRVPEGDPRSLPERQPRAGGQAVSRQAERRVSSFGERVPYRPQHSDSAQRGSGLGAQQSGGARSAQRTHEQTGQDRSSDYPKRPR